MFLRTLGNRRPCFSTWLLPISRERRSTVEAVSGLPVTEAVVGFSSESILDALGGTLTPLFDALNNGLIRGIAGLVSCTTLRDSGQDVHSVRIAKELIRRNVLVLSMGCGNGAMQVAGLTSPDAKTFAGEGLKKVCETLDIPPVLSFGTCTDTGQPRRSPFSDFQCHGHSYPRTSRCRRRSGVYGTEGDHRRGFCIGPWSLYLC